MKNNCSRFLRINKIFVISGNSVKRSMQVSQSRESSWTMNATCLSFGSLRIISRSFCSLFWLTFPCIEVILVTVWRTCDERGECHMIHVTQCHVMSWWMLGGTPLRIYRLSRRRVISDSHDPGNCLWGVSDDAERQRAHHKSQMEF